MLAEFTALNYDGYTAFLLWRKKKKRDNYLVKFSWLGQQTKNRKKMYLHFKKVQSCEIKVKQIRCFTQLLLKKNNFYSC